jgi:hypothetical protein
VDGYFSMKVSNDFLSRIGSSPSDWEGDNGKWMTRFLGVMRLWKWLLFLDKYFEVVFQLSKTWALGGFWCRWKVETKNHLFIKCDFFVSIWYAIFNWFGVVFILLGDLFVLNKVSLPYNIFHAQKCDQRDVLHVESIWYERMMQSTILEHM